MDNPNIEVIKERNNLKFYDNKTNCKVIYNTASSLFYDLAEFSCGDRGKGQGLKLLYYSLQYIQTKIPPRERPFRIELLVVPSSTDETKNDFYKLQNYYKQLGFQEDNNAKIYGVKGKMFVLLDTLVVNVKNKLEQKAGKKRKSYKNRTYKKTIKRIKYKKTFKKNNRL